MAEAVKPVSDFLVLENEIVQTIDSLIDLLQARKKELLLKLENLRVQYCTQSVEYAHSIVELQAYQNKLRGNLEKSNTIMKIQDYTLKTIKNEITHLHSSVELPSLYLSHNSEDLKRHIGTMDIVESSVDLSVARPPLASIGKEGKKEGRFNFPVRLVIDELAKKILVVDRHNARVQVFSLLGQFLVSFGGKQLKHPMGICLDRDSIFLTDSHHHCVFKYNRADYKYNSHYGGLGKVEGQLDYPTCVEVCPRGDVYVGELNNWRVSRFSSELKLLSTLCNRKCQPSQLRAMEDHLLILSTMPLGIYMFSYGDILLETLSIQIQQTCDVSGYNLCQSFFVSRDGLFFIPNLARHCIDVWTKDGTLVKRVGRRGKGKGELHFPFDVCVTGQGTMLVASGNPNAPVQIF